MTKTLVNQTLAVVLEEAALLPEHFPHRGYQTIMGNTELHLELISYVLSRIPNIYAVQDANIQPRGYTTAYRLNIETLLQQGIHSILVQQPNRFETSSPFEETARLIRA